MPTVEVFLDNSLQGIHLRVTPMFVSYQMYFPWIEDQLLVQTDAV